MELPVFRFSPSDTRMLISGDAASGEQGRRSFLID